MRITSLLPLVALAACQSVNPPKLTLTYSTPPISLDGINAKFSANISYDNYPRSVFDIFIPDSTTATPAVLFIHGGGFLDGDKSSTYSGSDSDNIREYLRNGIAFIAVNYRFMTDDLSKGLYTSLNDIHRCIQFIRYYYTSFNIKKAKIASYGGSAGGGASIWLNFHPNMANSSATELLQRESTRLVAAGHTTSQVSYDPEVVDAMFKAVGITNYYQMKMVKEQIFVAYVITNLNQLDNDPRVVAMRADVDMLGLMTADDPEFYTQTDNPIIAAPASAPEANHVPLHARTLVEKAKRIGLGYKARIPAYSIDTTGGETMNQFIIRKLKA